MKILVFGAGVLGSLFAARLQETGHDVTLLARGQRLADLREHGIILEDDATSVRTTTQVKVIERLDPEATFDWVIVVVRKNQIPSVLPSLAANHHTPNVLFMLNNAAGPQMLANAIGAERVVLSFPLAGGGREGAVIHYTFARSKMSCLPLGDLSGQVTPRLQKIGAAFDAAGFPVTFISNMDAWLKTHVAVVSPIANALYLAGGDNYRLARTRDGIVLMVRAVREGFRVLRALGIPVTPPFYRVLEWIPEPLLVVLLQRRLPSRTAELALARHANAARDEMTQLAAEFRELARRAAIPTPAMVELYDYLDPAAPTVADGASGIPMDWRGVWAGAGILAGLGLTLGWLIARNRRKCSHE